MKGLYMRKIITEIRDAEHGGFEADTFHVYGKRKIPVNFEVQASYEVMRAKIEHSDFAYEKVEITSKYKDSTICSIGVLWTKWCNRHVWELVEYIPEDIQDA